MTKANAASSKLSPDDLDGILKRLQKLKPGTKTAASHSIAAMFTFGPPVSEEKVTEIFDALKKRGDVKIDGNGKLTIRNVQTAA